VFPGAKAVVLLRFWHPAGTGRTCPAPPFPVSWTAAGRLVPDNRTQDTPAPSASRSGYVRGNRNAVKPRIQGVLAPWNPGSRAFWRR